MRVLISGSRHWDDYKTFLVVMAGFNALYDQLTVIEGDAGGLDKMGERFVLENERPGLSLMKFPAKWKVHDREGLTPVKCWCSPGQETCKPAGHRRNQQMIDEGNPAVLVSFKDALDPELKKGGSEDMIKRAQAAGLPVIHVDHGFTR